MSRVSSHRRRPRECAAHGGATVAITFMGLNIFELCYRVSTAAFVAALKAILLQCSVVRI